VIGCLMIPVSVQVALRRSRRSRRSHRSRRSRRSRRSHQVCRALISSPSCPAPSLTRRRPPWLGGRHTRSCRLDARGTGLAVICTGYGHCVAPLVWTRSIRDQVPVGNLATSHQRYDTIVVGLCVPWCINNFNCIHRVSAHTCSLARATGAGTGRKMPRQDGDRQAPAGSRSQS